MHQSASSPVRSVRARPAALGVAALMALGTAPAEAAPLPTRWVAPIWPPAVMRGFDPPAKPWLPGHRGVDLRAQPGAPVRAAGAGRVTHAGQLAGRGVVVVDHGGLRTTYEPVAASVVVGQRVAAGAMIGRVVAGSGHCGDARCLHLGVRRGRTYLDPRLLLSGRRAVLRPWSG
jgi:murein DD-endopeptidase MepM/ murein hydrolase activator NlpD